MAQVGVAKELPDSPSGQVTIGDDSSSEFERKFIVEFDSTQNGPLDACYAIGVPPDWSTYSFGSENNGNCRLYNKKAERMGVNPDASCYWEVTCKYKTKDEDDDDPDDPTNEPPQIEGDFHITNELCHASYKTSDPDPTEGIRNTAGELFKQQITKEVDNQILIITRNENIATNVPNLSRLYNNRINNAPIVIVGVSFPFHSVRCRIKFSKQHKETGSGPSKTQVTFWKVRYEIAHREETWDLKLLDYGSYHLDNDGNKINFKTTTGDRYLGLLNGIDGKESKTPKFIVPPLRVYDTADFSTLNLPTSYI